jgi:hypothetical protein
MKKAFFAAMMALGIGAAASPAFARGEGNTMVDPNPIPAGLYDGTAQEPPAQIANQRLVALAMRWIAAQNNMQVADASDG